MPATNKFFVALSRVDVHSSQRASHWPDCRSRVATTKLRDFLLEKSWEDADIPTIKCYFAAACRLVDPLEENAESIMDRILSAARTELQTEPEYRTFSGVENDRLDLDALEEGGWEAVQLGREVSVLVNAKTLERVASVARAIEVLAEKVPMRLEEEAPALLNLILPRLERILLPQPAEYLAAAALALVHLVDDAEV